MELRQYWNVLWRRRWIVLAIILLVAAISLAMFVTAKKTYRADAHFTSRWDPAAPTAVPGSESWNFDDYYRWFSNEFLVDDYTQIVVTDAFGRDVLDTARKNARANGPAGIEDPAKLQSDLDHLNSKNVAGYVDADRKQRILRVSFNTPSRDVTLALLNAAGEVLTSGSIKPYRGETKDRPLFGQMDEITRDNIQSSSSREITNAAIRIILGIAAAIAVAFLLEYLDRSVRDERDASRVLDVPVLGAIPRI